MTLLRGVEIRRRLFDRGSLRVTLRASGLVVEQRLLRAENRVLHDDVVREIHSDRRLAGDVHAADATAKVENEIGEAYGGTILNPLRQHAARREWLCLRSA